MSNLRIYCASANIATRATSDFSDIFDILARPAATVYDMPNSAPHTVRYNSVAIANLLIDNGIENKRQLSQVTKIPTSTLNDQFNEAWEGHPTLPVLAQIAATFRVNAATLIVQPWLQANRRPMSGKTHLPAVVAAGARRGGRVR